jgi:hypothetical protein
MSMGPKCSRPFHGSVCAALCMLGCKGEVSGANHGQVRRTDGARPFFLGSEL